MFLSLKQQMTDISSGKKVEYKRTLLYFSALLLFSIFLTNIIILTSSAHDRHATTVIMLNIAAGSATGLGIISVFRYRLAGSHGISYIFLTLGITLWFCADFNILYLYFIEGIAEQNQFSFSDIFWLSGYAFLSLHLISVMRTIRIKSNSKTISILLIFVIGFIIINIIQSSSYNLFSDEAKGDIFTSEYGLENLIITILYPILDLSLMVPSVMILVNLYHEYQHSIPWVLSSASLLTNAIADNGYVNDFIRGSPSSWIWDLLYVNDFIIMAAALYWFNRFHISDSLREKKNK